MHKEKKIVSDNEDKKNPVACKTTGFVVFLDTHSNINRKASI